MYKNRKIVCPKVTLLNILLPKIGNEIKDAKNNKIYKAPEWIYSLFILFLQVWLTIPFLLAHFFIDDYINNFFLSVFIGYLFLLILDYFIACILFEKNNEDTKEKENESKKTN